MARSVILTLFVVFFVIVFYLYRGVPIHDINVWSLERSFARTNINHPKSVLLEKKTYLGGPDTHGSQRCVYAVGEMRVTPLKEDNIRQAYQNITVKFGSKTYLPLKVFFVDGEDWPQELPFVMWQDKLLDMFKTENTVYIVYVSTEHPFLLDQRCDD